MKRVLASLLGLALALGTFPSAAAAQVLSAPVAIPASFVPASAAAAAAIAASPASATAALALAPLAPAAPAPALVADAPERAAAASAAAPTVAALRADAALETPLSRALFDGSAPRPSPDAAVAPSAAADVRPGLAPPTAPPEKSRHRTWLFEGSLLAASASVAAAPVLWSAASALKLGYLEAFSLLPALVLVAAVRLLRLAFRRPAPDAPSRRSRWTSAALGLALGATVGLIPMTFEGPLVERLASAVDSRRPERERLHMRAVPGNAMSDETLKVLSANPVGRQVLDRLRDRGGVVRLPKFYVARLPSAYAEQRNAYGSVSIGTAEIARRGWTVERFLADPALQRQLVREMAPIVAHELTHEFQGRLSVFSRELRASNTMEDEYEAFLVEHAYVHAELQADPSAPLEDDQRFGYRAALDDVDVWLKDYDALYPQNVHREFPRWRKFYADTKADWPAHRVEGYLLLARRDAVTSPKMAKMDLALAKAAAAKAGLPAPTLTLPDGK